MSYLDPQPSLAGVLTQQETKDTIKSGAYAPLELWKADMDRRQGRALLEIVQRIYDTVWRPRAPIPQTEPLWEPRLSIGQSAVCPSAILARTWLQLGMPSLAEVYMAHIRRLSPSPPKNWDELLLDAAITCAFRHVEQGKYEHAISSLVSKNTLYQITSLSLHQQWQDAIWHVMYVRARRQNHTATLWRLEQLCPGVHEWYEPIRSTEPTASAWLREAQKMIHARQPHQSLEVLMKALAASEAQQLFPMRRTCLAVLADTMIMSLGMHTEARALLDEIFPQVLADENAERRAYVHMVLGKYFLATKELVAARASLRVAAQNYECLEAWKDQAVCLYLEASVSHLLQDTEAHVNAAQRHGEVQFRADEAHTASCPMAPVDALERLVCRMSERCQCSLVST